MEGLYIVSYLVAAVDVVRCPYAELLASMFYYFPSRLFSPRTDFSEILIKKKQIIILRHEKKTMNQPKKNKKSESISDSTAHPKRRR